MAVEEILQEALALPAKERGELAAALLLRSIEPEDETELTEAEREAAWTKEIDRRLRDFDEGRTTAISHDELKDRVRARLRQQ